MTNLAAHLQVLRNTDKLDFVLRNFRRFYPDTYVGLYSDAGDDLSVPAAKYNCDYTMGKLNTGASPFGFTFEQTLEWVTRLHTSIVRCNAEYIIYLEDDVLIRGPVNVNPKWKLASVLENPIHPWLNDFSVKNFGYAFNTNLYGACGGAIYHVPTFIECAPSIFNIINKHFNEFQNGTGGRFGFLDMFMPVFFMMNGVSISLNTEQTECHRNPFWETSNHTIIHGKLIYNHSRAI